MTETEAAYIAGLIDGEGCIYVGRRLPKPAAGERTPQFVLGVRVVMCAESLIRWLPVVTGLGQVYVFKQRNANARPSWSWVLAARQARALLEEIRPHLRLKREQADLFIEICGLRDRSGMKRYGSGQKRYAPERQLAIHVRMRQLNKRGAA